MNAVLLLATEATGDEASGLEIILPAAAELFYGAISFAIVFLLLSRLVFPRINKMLEERSEAIQGKLEDADKALAGANATKGEYEAKLQDARTEANSIIEEAKQQAEQVRAQLRSEAEAEAEAIRARARADAATEKERLISELKGQVGTLSVQLAGKIVEKELDSARHQGLVDQYIAELSPAGASGGGQAPGGTTETSNDDEGGGGPQWS
jgi:F-type H+-transporting ATPase subunit b